MAVTKVASTLGEITTNFLMSDFDVFLMNTSATGGYVSTDFALMGYTGLEKTITRGREKFTKEAKLPRVPIFSKTLRKSFSCAFDLCNFNEDLMAIFTQSSKIDLGATGTKLSHGTDEPNIEYRAIRFAAKLEDNRNYIIDVPKAEVLISGDQTVGGDENSVIPLSVSAFFNPLANATASLYQELWLTAGLNPTAVPPPGYN